MRKLLVWGTSGHASVVADAVRLTGEFELFGFLDDVDSQKAGTEFCGAPVFGGRERLGSLRREGVGALVFGFGDCAARLRLAEFVRGEGFELASVIHPSAVVARGVAVGAGSVVLAGAVVNPGVWIGDNVIVNTSCSVDHDSVLEDGVHVSPGAHLAGNVRVGRGAWVGIGAVVVERASIGAGSIIGAGAVVVGDIPAGVVAYGVPAKVTRRVDRVD